MGETDAAGTDLGRTAADDRGQRSGMVRIDERGSGHQRDVVVKGPGHRMHRRHLEGLLVVQRRQDPGQPTREHRLAGPWRPDHRQMVPARGRDLQRQPRLRLPEDVGEIRTAHPTHSDRRDARDQLLNLAPQAPDQIPQVPHPPHRHPGRQSSLGQIPDRHDRPFPTGGPGGQQRGQHTPHRPDLPVQSQLPDEHRAPGRPRRHHTRRSQNRNRQSDVVTGAALGQGGRRQRQRDPPIGPFLPRIHHRRPDPIPRLRHGGVTHPDHRRPWQTRRQIRLHRDQMAGHPGQGDRPGPRQRHQNASTR